MKISDNFDVREFVPEDVYKRHGGKSIGFINKRLIDLIERIRTLCGNRAITINNWHRGGRYQYRGYRPQNCKIGAKYSAHKAGLALDFDVKDMTADQVREIIRDNQSELMELGLTRMETGISWVHIDMKETGLKYIKEFRP